jgi:hypothetical protein
MKARLTDETEPYPSDEWAGLSSRPASATFALVTAIESELLDALNELEDAARRACTAPAGTSLLPLLGRIDRLAGQLPPGMDPELRHFLARKSYAKARESLAGRVPTRGHCGGGGDAAAHA